MQITLLHTFSLNSSDKPSVCPFAHLHILNGTDDLINSGKSLKLHLRNQPNVGEGGGTYCKTFI